MSVPACRASTLTLCACCIALLLPPRPALADFTDLEVVERTDLPICQDPSEPEIPYKLDVCEVYAVFDDSADRLISVAFSNVSTTAAQGFFQHTLGGNTAPACGLIALEPTVECDSFVTLGVDCFDSIDGSTLDPDFDSTGFHSSGEVSGGWYNSTPANGQGAPDANGRVLIARFSYKQNKNTSGDVCVFTKLAGSDDITEFLLLPFDCSNPGMQGVGGGGGGAGAGGSCGCETGGGPCLCADVPLGGTNEPAFAVNPTDPLNIAVSWNPHLAPDEAHVQLTVSTDGGQCWTAPTDAPLPPVCAPPAECTALGDPVLTFNSNGRLYWSYLANINPLLLKDIVVAEMDPITGQTMGDAVQVINTPGMAPDKEWLAAGLDRIYVVWVNIDSTPRPPDPPEFYIAVSHIDVDLSQGWSAPHPLSETDGFDLASFPHVAVGGDGTAYVAYNFSTEFPPSCVNEGETRGVAVQRSIDGGQNWLPTPAAYEPGEADVTNNVQTCPQTRIPQTRFLNVGSFQPWIVPDPLVHNRVYIIAADDPDNDHADHLDDSHIYIVRSDDFGATWDDLALSPQPIELSPPPDTFQVFPTAAIDPVTGDLAVLWYDNRDAGTFQDPFDPGGPKLFYLNVWFSISTDLGVSFSAPQRINDQRVDHVAGADEHSPGVTRIGEYIGVGLGTHIASNTQYLHAAWTGNEQVGQDVGQQIFFGSNQCDACPWDLDDNGSVEAFDLALLLGVWGLNPCGPPDFNGDGNVDASDLAALLGNWGLCS